MRYPLGTLVTYQRVYNQHGAKLRYPDLAGRLIPALGRADPLADAVILAENPAVTSRELGQALTGARSSHPQVDALVQSAASVPAWVDWERIERAKKVFFRAGLLGGLTLGLRSLVAGYCAPAGNKPLSLSGRLTERADRRLAETGHFAKMVCCPQALRPFHEGFGICVRVRLMHARVRHLALRDPRWNTVAWGIPINQHDMLATILLFSSVFVDGLRAFGVRVSEREADDFQHLYRWVGHLMGVDDELLPFTHLQATRAMEFIALTQGPPDDDSRALVRALLEGPLRAASTPQEKQRAHVHVAIASGLCRAQIGEERADQLGLPRDGTRFILPAARRAFHVLEGLRKTYRLDSLVEGLGVSYWDFSVQRGLAGVPARYAPPATLSRAAGRERDASSNQNQNT